jgi:hypothetical protein
MNLKPFSIIIGNFLATSGINGLNFRITYPLNMLEKVEIRASSGFQNLESSYA